MAMIGRLKPGVTAAQAQAEIGRSRSNDPPEHPERNGFEGIVKPLGDQVSGRVRLAVWVLAGAVAMVMLIVCANLSNLLLARTAARQKEFAIRRRSAPADGGWSAQMLTEGLVLSSSGALLGLALALAGTRAAHRSSTPSASRCCATCAPTPRRWRSPSSSRSITGVVFGLAPALQASRRRASPRAEGCHPRIHRGPRRAWVRNALVVSEIAFACVLLVGAGC